MEFNFHWCDVDVGVNRRVYVVILMSVIDILTVIERRQHYEVIYSSLFD